jgi:hypothetical protein
MVRSRWFGALAGVVTLTGMALGNSPCANRVIDLQEQGKPAEKCKVLRCWKQKDGRRACQVQSLASGEIMTILDMDEPVCPFPKAGPAHKASIFHWGSGRTSPALAPPVPPDAVVLGESTDAVPKSDGALCSPCVSTGTVIESPQEVPAAPARRPSLLGRVFGSAQPAQSPCACSADCSTEPPSRAKQDDKAAAPALAKAEDKAEAKKPQDRPAAPPARKGVLQRLFAKDDKVARKQPEPKKTATRPADLPHAGPVLDDPLKLPEVYTKVKLPDAPGAGASKASRGPSGAVSPAGGVAKTSGAVQQASASDQPPAKAEAPAAPAALPTAAAPPQRKLPLGMGSVFAARSPQLVEVGKDGRAYPANSVPVAAANAFTEAPPPAPPQGLQSAFTGAPPRPYPPAMPYGPYPPAMLYGGYPQYPPMYAYPRSVAPPPAIDQGSAPGMANAFTFPGITRPIPADMGPTPAMPNAFVDEGAALHTPQMARMPAPAYPPPGYAPVPGYPAPLPYGGVNRGTLLAMLRDSLYPSERETAAEYLAYCDWRRDPQVVQALLTAAQSDPAPSVRAGCVRLLGRMHVTAAPVITAVQALQTDPDPRVRLAVGQTLPSLKTP